MPSVTVCENMISVIIPYYHSYSLFFNDCYRSIINQTYSNYECIIATTIDEYNNMDKSVFNDSRFLLCISPKIDQSSKRNCGLKMANGDFVAFLDCDDEYDKYFLFTCNEIIKKFNPDLTIFNFSRDKNENQEKPLIDGDFVENKEECIENIFGFAREEKAKYNCWYDSVCSKLFKKSVILQNNVFFVEEMKCAEDSVFVRNYSIYIRNMYIFNDYKAYFWRINEHSTMNSPFSGFFDVDSYFMNMLKVIKQADVYEKEAYSKYASYIFSDRISFLLSLYFKGKIKLREYCFVIKHNYNAKVSIKSIVSLKYIASKKVKLTIISIRYRCIFILSILLPLFKMMYKCRIKQKK